MWVKSVTPAELWKWVSDERKSNNEKSRWHVSAVMRKAIFKVWYVKRAHRLDQFVRWTNLCAHTTASITTAHSIERDLDSHFFLSELLSHSSLVNVARFKSNSPIIVNLLNHLEYLTLRNKKNFVCSAITPPISIQNLMGGVGKTH